VPSRQCNESDGLVVKGSGATARKRWDSTLGIMVVRAKTRFEPARWGQRAPPGLTSAEGRTYIRYGYTCDDDLWLTA